MTATDATLNSAAADTGVARVRSSLLLLAQTGRSDVASCITTLEQLNQRAVEQGRTELAARVSACVETLRELAASPDPATSDIHSALDQVARIEAAMFEAPLHSNEFICDAADLLELAFLDTPREAPPAESLDVFTDFEIDDETYEIFRSEAEELIGIIDRHLASLSATPDDKTAIWEMRRAAHTLKGSAAILGMADVSEVAHRMEDLLDEIVESGSPVSAEVHRFISASSRRLDALVHARPEEDGDDLLVLFDQLTSGSATPANAEVPTQTPSEAPKHYSTPVVRASLDRLNELLALSRELIRNHADMSAALARGQTDLATRILWGTEQLSRDLQTRLQQIRMVKFGTLETRLSRTVQATCSDQNKRASVTVENGHIEIDTLVIDALIEPLLHILKNAVVHGLELSETRRLIGKPEQGSITVRIEADEEALVLSVKDDGAGISVMRLKETAIARGIVDADVAATMSARDALKLVFEKGLTTAERIDLNAGRGIGMSIVKEAIEARGGSVLVESEPMAGTTFTILMPLTASGLLPDRTAEDTATAKRQGPPLALVVDDSRTVRQHTLKLVEKEGFRAISAENGAEALELLLSGAFEPDIIFSDVEMPQIDGWELLEYIKTDDNLGHIPVVLVTSLDSTTHEERARQLGAAAYVVKPLRSIDVKDLISTLEISA